MSVARGRRGMVLPSVLALAGFLVLIGLGTWQVERKAWKEALIATLDARLSAAPVAMPPPAQWFGMNAGDWEFTRVRLHVEFASGKDALLFSSGSALRDDAKPGGYFVFAPARLPDGGQVVIDRGFVPDRSYPSATGSHDIVGALRWPESPSWFVAAHDTAGEVWTVRDPKAMAAFKDWGAVAPFYVEMESPAPAGGLPHPSALKVHLRNEHLQYAVTWYGLAAALAVIFGLWARRRRRDEAA